jgi:hypothetical protein
MMDLALQHINTRKAKLNGLLFFSVFVVMYTLIDVNNLPYTQMMVRYGTYLVAINVFLNVLMASMSSLMLMLSTANVALKGKESLGSNTSFLSVIFGVLTYGCTPCVIAFFSTIGIAFSVAVLPLAGLPYKFISVGLLLIGLFWTRNDIIKGSCSIKKES